MKQQTTYIIVHMIFNLWRISRLGRNFLVFPRLIMSINGISLHFFMTAKMKDLRIYYSQNIRYELEVPSDGLALVSWSSSKTNLFSSHWSQDLYVPCAVQDVSFEAGCGIFSKEFWFKFWFFCAIVTDSLLLVQVFVNWKTYLL